MAGINRFKLCSLVTICLLILASSCVHKQNKNVKCNGFQDSLLHKFVYKTVDVAPEPLEGIGKVTKLLAKNFKYPPGDVDYYGRVVVAFVVEADGSIDGKRTLHDLSGRDSLFSKQLLDILGSVKWKPGLCNGTKVACLYTFPLNIDIQE